VLTLDMTPAKPGSWLVEDNAAAGIAAQYVSSG
jgi:hypothetical protein